MTLKMENRTRAWLLAALAACASASDVGCAGRGNEGQSDLKKGIAVVPVTVTAVERRPVERTVEVVGTLKGWEEVKIGAKKEARVRKVFHDMGDRVEPGALLVAMETEDADLAVKLAERELQAELAKLGLKELPKSDFDVTTVPSVVQKRVTLEKAIQNLARERSLMQRNAGTMQDFQNAENDVKSAEAAQSNAILTAQATLASALTAKVRLEVADHDRKELEIRAPVPSHRPECDTTPVTYAVSKRSVSEGQMVKMGDAIMELVIERPLRLWSNVPEAHSGDVMVGQAVRVSGSSVPGMVFEGEVARINPAVDPVSRTFQVEARVPNRRGLLRPGGFAKASILIAQSATATVVPNQAVVKFAGVTKLFLVEAGKARSVNVETGLELPGAIEVTTSLPKNAVVVVDGLSKLADGTPVTVRETIVSKPDANAAPPQPATAAGESAKRPGM
jgi:multidrug efflux pump subunit AcrA (membrane-fusion protein)